MLLSAAAALSTYRVLHASSRLATLVAKLKDTHHTELELCLLCFRTKVTHTCVLRGLLCVHFFVLYFVATLCVISAPGRRSLPLDSTFATLHVCDFTYERFWLWMSAAVLGSGCGALCIDTLALVACVSVS